MKKLILNFDEGSLNGYVLGSSSYSNDIKKKSDEYMRKGYRIYSIENKVLSIIVYYHSHDSEIEPFKGSVVINDQEHLITKNTKFDDISLILGKPFNHFNDEVEICAEFIHKNIQIEFIWNIENKSLDYIAIEQKIRG